MHYSRPQSVRQNLHLSSRGLLAELAGNGIIVPDALADLAEHVERLEQRQKTTETDRDHRDASLALLADDPDADIDETADAELRAQTVINTLFQATEDASRRLRQAITAHADELTEAIRDTLFDPALETLTVAAKAGVSTSTDALLRDGNIETARAVADVPIARAKVRTAYRLRAKLYAGGNIDDFTCSTWRKPNPRDFYDVDDDDRLIVGIRSGHELWFGTYTEVDRASRDHADKLKAEEKAHRAKVAQAYGIRSGRPRAKKTPTPDESTAPPPEAA